MKQIISIVPTKELPLAIASITVWNVILLIGGYSTGDWIGVVILGYIAVWVSRLLIVKPVELVSRLNLRRLKTTADLMGIELSEESLANHKVPLWAALLVGIFVFALLVSILGLAMVITGYLVAFPGLAPLNPGVHFYGLIGLSVGLGYNILYLFSQHLLILRLEKKYQEVVQKSASKPARVEVSPATIFRLTNPKRVDMLTQPALS